MRKNGGITGVVLAITLILIAPEISAFLLFDDTPPGFTERDLHAPVYAPYTVHSDDPPVVSQDIMPIINCKLQPIIIGEIYADFGGTARIYLINNNRTDFQRPGSDMYILNISILWHNSIKTTRAVNRYAMAGEKVDLGIWNFETPHEPGKYLYNFEITVFGRDSSTGLWAGPRNVSFKESEMDVTPLGNFTRYLILHNDREIYGRINELAKPTEKVNAKITALKNSTTGNYSTALLLSIFEYVCTLNYTQEPEGVDYWQNPDETMDMGGGDCEDFAILIASLVCAAGGTVRFCYTNTHAFASVYVSSDFEVIQDAVDRYYRHHMNMVFLSDEFGYWVVADPAGEPYLGGLPVSGIPANFTNSTWDWYINSTFLGIIDITLKSYIPLSRYVYPFTITAIMLALLIVILVLYARTLPKCTVCGIRIKKHYLFRCPVCNAPYHVECKDTLNACTQCNFVFKPESDTSNTQSITERKQMF